MDVPETKWVNSILNIIGVNSLGHGGTEREIRLKFIIFVFSYAVL